ncbi:sensor histidine kinase [Nocardia brasiliensis]|uniref:sensor histidine kinase n=1 Tax=Nocardia brasiliensis TaxID=37326 RepID=UPI0024541932|nr:HAMP domain-containing sensor histidine kinase [Nocardia brasiliensis]
MSTWPVIGIRGGSLRARIRLSIVVVTALSVLLFAIPLAMVVERMNHTEAVTELQRDAVGVAALIPETVVSDSESAQLPPDLPDDRIVGIYTLQGCLIHQNGPATSRVAAAAADGRTHVATEGSELVVSAPVSTGRAVIATVRVSAPIDLVNTQTRAAWAAMVLLGAGAMAVAGVLARYVGRRIAEPLERLTASARSLGDGDFTIQPPRSRITEADALADALEATAKRLGTALERERAFSTSVSHQLRTPLTALLLGLESALSQPHADLRQSAANALRRAERLVATIEELLRLARDTTTVGPRLVVAELAVAVRDHWEDTFAEQGRVFLVHCADGLPDVYASATAVRHVIEVLVDNAFVHGAGLTTVDVYAVGGDLMIEVSDEGPGLIDVEAAFALRESEPTSTHGIGLALARSLAEAQGGRLILRHASPCPIFGLLLQGSSDLKVCEAPNEADRVATKVDIITTKHSY